MAEKIYLRSVVATSVCIRLYDPTKATVIPVVIVGAPVAQPIAGGGGEWPEQYDYAAERKRKREDEEVLIIMGMFAELTGKKRVA